ncbi:MAG TPA: hypothetical protein VE135_26870 [Pyrinomonadaceae bacterium]|nr:hypothetical protein [Pyrinomonadaceae bacterium]
MARRRRESNLREYRFKIDAYTPQTIPLIRLTDYLHDLAVLFGNTDDVHLDKIAEGSTEPILLVEREAEVKVRERLQAVRANDGPEDAMRAHKNINERLREDDGKGSIIDPIRRKILIFQGRDLNKLLEYGPFTQPGTLEGTPIKIGGEQDWVPVHLEDSLGAVRWCWARRSLARDIAQHIFTSVIRVDGTARWLRKRDGEWDMVSFRAKGFTVLDSDITLRESIDHLRAIPAKWKELDDPLGELKKIRHGT